MRDALRDGGEAAAGKVYQEVAQRRQEGSGAYRFSVFDVLSYEQCLALFRETAEPSEAATQAAQSVVDTWSQAVNCDDRATQMLKQLPPDKRFGVMTALRITPKTRNPSAALVGLCVAAQRGARPEENFMPQTQPFQGPMMPFPPGFGFPEFGYGYMPFNLQQQQQHQHQHHHQQPLQQQQQQQQRRPSREQLPRFAQGLQQPVVPTRRSSQNTQGMTDPQAARNSRDTDMLFAPEPASEAAPSTRRASIVVEAEAGEEGYEEQVEQYATVLGMDLDGDDSFLLWIAREGLVAPIPNDWMWSRSPNGEIYYIHAPTRHTQWEHPADARYRELLAHRRALLLPVLTELRRLEFARWVLHLPGIVAPPLFAGTFVDERTLLRKQRSTPEGLCAPVRCRVEEIPPVAIARLGDCVVSFANPGHVDLGVAWSGGQAVGLWLEVLWDGVTMSITFREHAMPRQTRSAAAAPVSAAPAWGGHDPTALATPTPSPQHRQHPNGTGTVPTVPLHPHPPLHPHAPLPSGAPVQDSTAAQ
eukprot:Hpha_TRINITY_DN15164_c4_g4::TRINITY_DN15164_c4_g4_i1::g.129305::m.129305